MGVVRGTLCGWLEVYSTGKKTAAHETMTSSQMNDGPSTQSGPVPADGTLAQRIARLETRVAELEVSELKPTAEREIHVRGWNGAFLDVASHS